MIINHKYVILPFWIKSKRKNLSVITVHRILNLRLKSSLKDSLMASILKQDREKLHHFAEKNQP